MCRSGPANQTFQSGSSLSPDTGVAKLGSRRYGRTLAVHALPSSAQQSMADAAELRSHKIPKLVADGWPRFPSVLQRYYETYTTSGHVSLHVNANGLCVLALAPTHPMLQPPNKVTGVSFTSTIRPVPARSRCSKGGPCATHRVCSLLSRSLVPWGNRFDVPPQGPQLGE